MKTLFDGKTAAGLGAIAALFLAGAAPAQAPQPSGQKLEPIPLVLPQPMFAAIRCACVQLTEWGC